MARVDAKGYQEKHARRLKASLDDIAAGVKKVTVAPTLEAAKKIDKMRANWIRAADDGKIEAGFKRVSLDDWKDSMLNKGVGNISRGIDGAAKKVEAFAEQFLPYLDAGVSKIKSMPDVTLEDGIQRAAEMIRHNAAFRRK
jgi:hypothetical protein